MSVSLDYHHTHPSIHSTAATEDFDYLTVRPGRLVGGPWTNVDLSNLLKAEEGTRKRVVVERGDALNGDAARISVAELVVRVRNACVGLCGWVRYPCSGNEVVTQESVQTHFDVRSLRKLNRLTSNLSWHVCFWNHYSNSWPCEMTALNG